MAIAGFIIHMLPENVDAVQNIIATMPELTSYGVHEHSHLVVVAEAHSSKIEALLNKVQGLEGVLAAYLTSLTLEDETTENNSTESNTSEENNHKAKPLTH